VVLDELLVLVLLLTQVWLLLLTKWFLPESYMRLRSSLFVADITTRFIAIVAHRVGFNVVVETVAAWIVVVVVDATIVVVIVTVDARAVSSENGMVRI